MALVISADTDVLAYSPGALRVNLTNGDPYAYVDLSIDSEPVVLTVQLDGNGQATSVVVPIDADVGAHTLYAS